MKNYTKIAYENKNKNIEVDDNKFELKRNFTEEELFNFEITSKLDDNSRLSQ